MRRETQQEECNVYIHARATQHCISLQVQSSNCSNNMSFLDIKDPAKCMDEYVRAMETVRRRNMVNRELKLAIGEELQTLFHPIVSATKQTAEKTTGELVPVKKALEDIDGALKAQQRHTTPPPSSTQKDHTFGIHATGDGRYAMGSSIVHIEGNTLKVDDKEYELTPGLSADTVQETTTSTLYQR